MKQRIHSILLLLAMLMFLDACGETGIRPTDHHTTEQLAEQAYARGDYEQAAAYWQRASKNASARQVELLLVKMADAWLKSGHTNRAARLLTSTNQDLLDQQTRSLYNLLNANLALQKNDSAQASSYLQAAALDLPIQLQNRFDELRSRLRALQIPDGYRLAEIEAMTRRIRQYQPVAVLKVLRSLEMVTSGQLKAMIASRKFSAGFTEWLELALQIRSAVLKPEQIEAGAKQWGAIHFGQVLDQAGFADLALRYRAMFSSPAQVAVLLPEEGGLAAAGKAIRDGILDAYFDHPGRSVLRFYASGDGPEAALAAYRQARIDGAKQVIGPLRIDSTRALSEQASPAVPILLLNDFSAGKRPNPWSDGRMSSLTLSQSEEASAIANQVLKQGQTHAIVMVPNDDWGVRIEAVFITQFEAGSGKVVATARFNPAGNENDAMLTQLLGIEASIERKQALQARLGIKLAFEPYRRQDFDFIFLAASPLEGRQLKPLLRFYDAGEVPIYAMGRIYSGRLEPESDQDLNGIIFPITRWQLQAISGGDSSVPESVRGGTLANLYALGQDAWQIIPWLPLLQRDPDLEYPGETGALRMQEDGHLYRQPDWAQFSAGLPKPYLWPANN